MLVSQDAAKTLNNLIETCIDGENGFRAAADALQNTELANELRNYSEQRHQFAARLQDLVGESGDTPTDSGSAAATLHRGWMNLRSAISSHDRYAILAECERGEDSAVEAYREAISEAQLPPDASQLIETQLRSVKSTHDRIKALRDTSKPA